MDDFESLLLIATIAAPAVAALLLPVVRPLGELITGTIALAGFAVPACAAFVLWNAYDPSIAGGYDFVTRTPMGLEGFGISLYLGLNGVSLPLFMLAGVVGLAAGLYALQSAAERKHQYLLLLLVMQSGLLGVFASIDVFFFYFFHEVALIPTFIMVGIWGGRDRQYAAMNMAVYLTIGAMLSLAGLIALYLQSGAETFDLISLRHALDAQPLELTVQKYAYALLLFGFGILVSLWPFHTWAPLGYGAAPSSAAMLHAGVLKKFGLYGLIQIGLPLLPQGASEWTPVLVWLALGNVVIIGLVTLAQRDVKQMIGYSSVMHMGYCFLGVATASVLGAGAAVYLMVAHGLSVSLLFMLATSLHARTGTFDMTQMGGLVKRTPVLAAFFAVAVFASIAVPGPGLATFWGELGVFMAVWDFEPWVLFPAALGIVLSAVYGLRALGRIFFGAPAESFRATLDADVRDLRWSERLPGVLLVVVLLVLGAWPRAITDSINENLQANLPAVTETAEAIAQN